MKQCILALISFACLWSSAYSQANGSFYTMQLGKKTCLFKYQEKPDTIFIYANPADKRGHNRKFQYSYEWVEEYVIDSIRERGNLILMDTAIKKCHIRPLSDTVDSNNPPVQISSIYRYTDFDYNIETEMSYFDFLLLLKNKFEIKSPQLTFRTYSFEIYYETPGKHGLIRVKYPQTYDGVISRLNCLEKSGGFLLLKLEESDHGQVKIDTGDRWLALIHIKP